MIMNDKLHTGHVRIQQFGRANMYVHKVPFANLT